MFKDSMLIAMYISLGNYVFDLTGYLTCFLSLCLTWDIP